MSSTLCAISLVALALADGRDDLGAVVRKGASADGYAFTLDERPARGTAGGIEGKYQKGQPASFTADGLEFFRQGGTVVFSQAGTWKRSKTGVESDPLVVLGAVAKVCGATMPHEELAVLAKHLKAIEKAPQKDGTTLYEGDLTAAGVEKLARSEHAGVARGGAARVWADAKGLPTKYEIVIRLQGRIGNAEIDGSSTRTVNLRAVGKTRVEVPEAATKALR
jgi:hypothetical protein